MNYDLTIAIPFFNDARNIRKLLNSINEQKHDLKIMVIIYDDASKVPFKLKNDYENLQIKIIRGDKNGGPAFARNQLLNEVNTTYLLFIDSDCLMEDPYFVKNIFNQKESSDLIYPKTYSQGELLHPQEHQIIPMYSTCFFMNVEKIKSKRIKFRTIFDFFCEDMCFFIECYKRGVQMKHDPSLSITHPRQTTGHSESSDRFTPQKQINLIKSYLVLRSVHHSYVFTEYYSFPYIVKLLKRNIGQDVKDYEYVNFILALFRYPFSIHKILKLKLIYAYDALYLFFNRK